MVDYLAQIKDLQDHLRTLQYNKATEHYFGVIKAKMAKLRQLHEKRSTKKTGGSGWFVKKSGDGTVVLLGFPSVGKSTLLNSLTGAKSVVGAYAFTTLTVVPGVMRYAGARIQILDVPGVVEGAATGRGRGKEVLAMVRAADMILILLDALHPEHLKALHNELYESGIRINKKPPDVRVVKTDRGGLDIAWTKKPRVSKETMKAICKEFKLNNARIVIRSPIDADEFVDVLVGNRVYVPTITVVTKTDLLEQKKRKALKKRVKADAMVSATDEQAIDELREKIFEALRFMRVYMKEVNKKPDLDEPLVVKTGTTIEGVCRKIHRDFVKKFRYARIWGPTAKFPGQTLKKMDRELHDGDIVEIHTT